MKFEMHPLTKKYLPEEGYAPEASAADLTSIVKRVMPTLLKRAQKLPRPASWELEDLVHIGLLAAFEALPLYKPEKGTLGGYVYISAIHAMWDACVEQTTAVRVSSSTVGRHKAQGRNTLSEFGTRSMETTVDVNGVSLQDRLSSGVDVEKTETSVEARLALSRLPWPEQQIVLAAAAGYTYGEIGETLGVSRQAVQQRVMIAVAESQLSS